MHFNISFYGSFNSICAISADRFSVIGENEKLKCSKFSDLRIHPFENESSFLPWSVNITRSSVHYIDFVSPI